MHFRRFGTGFRRDGGTDGFNGERDSSGIEVGLGKIRARDRQGIHFGNLEWLLYEANCSWFRLLYINIY